MMQIIVEYFEIFILWAMYFSSSSFEAIIFNFFSHEQKTFFILKVDNDRVTEVGLPMHPLLASPFDLKFYQSNIIHTLNSIRPSN